MLFTRVEKGRFQSSGHSLSENPPLPAPKVWVNQSKPARTLRRKYLRPMRAWVYTIHTLLHINGREWNACKRDVGV